MKVNNNTNIDQLIGKFKTEDNRYARISKTFRFIYWLFIPLYVLLILLEPYDLKHIISGVSYVISFVIFALFFGKFYKEYKHVDYSLPTITMLKQAAERYKPFQVKKLWLILALLFTDIGLSLNMSYKYSFWEVQIGYLGLMMLSVCVGLVIWYFKYKPMRDNALHLIAEIEGE